MAKLRGRPRQFDEQKVKRAILQAFWEKGFSATSLDDLSKASGLVRPSLYAAFGSKSEMYLMSMDVYHESLSSVRDALPAYSSAEEAVETLFLHMLDMYLGNNSAHQLGCFLVSTALTESPSNPEIRDALATKLSKFNRMLIASLQTKVPKVDPDTVQFAVEQIAATLHSLAVRARAGESRDRLTTFARQSARFITSNITTQ